MKIPKEGTQERKVTTRCSQPARRLRTATTSSECFGSRSFTGRCSTSSAARWRFEEAPERNVHGSKGTG